jgi:ArsR family transcriptional regulator
MPASTEPLAINLEEAYGHYFMLFKGNVVWVDIRSPQLYEAGHIQNALNIPANELEQKMASISQDKEVVFYCSGAGCEEADDAARMLIKNGFKQARIKVFQEGYSVWEDSGYPIEKGPPSFEGRHANI